MRKIILSLSAALLASTPVWAINCQVETDCSTLGYTETKDEGGCLKCPFGNQWACGTSGTAVGDILYSDMTTDKEIVSGKTPIGVVFDADRKLAIALEASTYGEVWMEISENDSAVEEKNFDVPGVKNYTSQTEALTDWQGKENTKTIIEYCQKNGLYCPTFDYIVSYSTEGTKAGNWYLPSYAEADRIDYYEEILNWTLGRLGKKKIPTTFQTSTEYDSTQLWYEDYHAGKNFSGTVLPVIDFSKTETPEVKLVLGPCKNGSILYSDKTCSRGKIFSEKTPIGVVFDVDKRLAMALTYKELSLGWGTGPELTEYTSFVEARKDFNGKENTKISIEYCQSNGLECPAFAYVNNYKTEGTNAGDWYLPAEGELEAMLDYYDYYTMGKVGNLNDITGQEYWSSTKGKGCAWRYIFGRAPYCALQFSSYYVRPAINY